MSKTDRLAEVTTASMHALLDLVGWPGTFVRSSDLTTSNERSERLANLTEAVGASDYLCGTGGMRYIEHGPFTTRGLRVIPFCVPTSGAEVWRSATRLSSLWALMGLGAEGIREELESAAKV